MYDEIIVDQMKHSCGAKRKKRIQKENKNWKKSGSIFSKRMKYKYKYKRKYRKQVLNLKI